MSEMSLDLVSAPSHTEFFPPYPLGMPANRPEILWLMDLSQDLRDVRILPNDTRSNEVEENAGDAPTPNSLPTRPRRRYHKLFQSILIV